MMEDAVAHLTALTEAPLTEVRIIAHTTLGLLDIGDYVELRKLALICRDLAERRWNRLQAERILMGMTES